MFPPDGPHMVLENDEFSYIYSVTPGYFSVFRQKSPFLDHFGYTWPSQVPRE